MYMYVCMLYVVLGVDSSAEMIEKAIRQGQQSLPADILSRVSYRCEKIGNLL